MTYDCTGGLERLDAKAALPPIIGLCGEVGSGKDSAADGLAPLGYRRLGFADALKEVCTAVYVPLGAAWRHFNGTQEDKAEPIAALGGITGRRILEVVGTEGYRAAYQDTWVALALVRARAHGLAVIPDVRFPNEFQAIRDAGGVVWRVVRVGGPQAPGTASRHASNEAWREEAVDAILVARHGDLGALQEQARAYARAGGRVFANPLA